MGGKIFGRDEDVEYGRKLTDGCVWAYGATQSGVMPEVFEVDFCRPDDNTCKYNEAKWLDSLVSPMWKPPSVAPSSLRKKKGFSRKPATGKKDSEARNAELKPSKTSDEKTTAKLDLKEPETADDHQDHAAAAKQKRSLKSRSEHTSPQIIEAEQSKYLDDEEEEEDEDEAEDNADDELDEDEEEYEEPKQQSREEYARTKAKNERLPGGFRKMDTRYILRPEAIESVWYMYRITGDVKWQEKGWKMWLAVDKATQSSLAHSAIRGMPLILPFVHVDIVQLTMSVEQM